MASPSGVGFPASLPGPSFPETASRLVCLRDVRRVLVSRRRLDAPPDRFLPVTLVSGGLCSPRALYHIAALFHSPGHANAREARRLGPLHTAAGSLSGARSIVDRPLPVHPGVRALAHLCPRRGRSEVSRTRRRSSGLTTWPGGPLCGLDVPVATTAFLWLARRACVQACGQLLAWPRADAALCFPPLPADLARGPPTAPLCARPRHSVLGHPCQGVGGKGGTRRFQISGLRCWQGRFCAHQLGARFGFLGAHRGLGRRARGESQITFPSGSLVFNPPRHGMGPQAQRSVLMLVCGFGFSAGFRSWSFGAAVPWQRFCAARTCPVLGSPENVALGSRGLTKYPRAFSGSPGLLGRVGARGRRH